MANSICASAVTSGADTATTNGRRRIERSGVRRQPPALADAPVSDPTRVDTRHVPQKGARRRRHLRSERFVTDIGCTARCGRSPPVEEEHRDADCREAFA